MRKTKVNKDQLINNAVELLMERQQGISVTPEAVIMRVPTKHGDIRNVSLTDDWLCRYMENLFLTEYKAHLSPGDSKLALRQIQAKAEFNNKVTRSYARTYFNDRVCYLNMGNQEGDIITISAEGVSGSSLADTEIQFRTDVGEIAGFVLSGNPFDLFKLIRIPSDLQLITMVTMIASMIESIEKPILSFIGEAGAAKTTAARIIKSILDPSDIKDAIKAKTSTMPKTMDNFALIISQQYVTIMDNVTYITKDISDMICQQSTGGNYEKRKLYTDTGTVSLSLGGLLIITSTEDIIQRDDAVDRAIKVRFEPVGNDERIGTSELVEKLEKSKMHILGGMLNTLSKALMLYPSIKDEKLPLPRLADFGRYGYAIAEALGDGLGNQFLNDYHRLREVQKLENLNNDGFFTTVSVLLTKNPHYWKGFIGQCAKALSELNKDEELGFPKSSFPAPNKFSKKLEATKHKLNHYGIKYNTYKKDGMAVLELLKIPADYLIAGRIIEKQEILPRTKKDDLFDIERVPILTDTESIKEYNEYFIRDVIADIYDDPYNSPTKDRILQAAINED